MNLDKRLMDFKIKDPILFNVSRILIFIYFIYQFGYAIGKVIAHYFV